MASVPFNNLITFSRGSNATVTGSNGLIQWAPNNLLLFSEQFDNSYWVKLNASVTANTSVAPDSSTTADTLTSTSSVASTTGTYRNVSLAVGHTMTAYAKAGSSSIAWVSGDNGESYGVFNLANGTVITSGGATASIISVGDGWYRLVVANTTVSNSYFIMGGKDTYTSGHPWANGTWTSGNTIRIWGAQVELGSAATTYNSTTVKNLLGYSEAFDNAAWTKTRASIVTGAQANPVNGAFNAQKLMEDTSAVSSHRVNSGTVTVATNSVVTVSVYLKAAERTWCRIADGGVTSSGAYVNLATGQFGTIASGVTRSSIVSVGNGWYRASITGVLASNLSQLFIDLADGDNVLTYTGNGNSGIYIYGAQLSDSASLDPYVPTPAAAPSSTAYYGPRFDYDPVTLQPKGLLVEEARTNGNLYSEDLSNVYWTVAGASLSGGNTAPSGSLVAYKLVENTANSTHQIGRLSVVSATNATAYTMSFYVKAAGRSRIRLYIYGFNNYTPILDLTSRTIVSAAGGTAPVVTFTNVSDGYIRITITDTTNASELQFDSVSLVSTGTTFNYTGDGVSGVILWGFQREVGSFATSYIPTVASTVTRSSDIATINGSLFSQWYGQTQGTFILEMSQVALGEFSRFLEATDITFNTRKPLMLMNSSNEYVMQFRDNGVDQASPVVGIMSANRVMKLSAAYRTNDFAGTLNGGTPVADTTGVVTTAVDRFFIGSGGSSPSDQISCHIRSINYIPTRIADFQLQALTELPLVPTLDLDFLNNLYEA